MPKLMSDSETIELSEREFDALKGYLRHYREMTERLEIVTRDRLSNPASAAVRLGKLQHPKKIRKRTGERTIVA